MHSNTVPISSRCIVLYLGHDTIDCKWVQTKAVDSLAQRNTKNELSGVYAIRRETELENTQQLNYRCPKNPHIKTINTSYILEAGDKVNHPNNPQTNGFSSKNSFSIYGQSSRFDQQALTQKISKNARLKIYIIGHILLHSYIKVDNVWYDSKNKYLSSLDDGFCIHYQEIAQILADVFKNINIESSFMNIEISLIVCKAALSVKSVAKSCTLEGAAKATFAYNLTKALLDKKHAVSVKAVTGKAYVPGSILSWLFGSKTPFSKRKRLYVGGVGNNSDRIAFSENIYSDWIYQIRKYIRKYYSSADTEHKKIMDKIWSEIGNPEFYANKSKHKQIKKSFNRVI